MPKKRSYFLYFYFLFKKTSRKNILRHLVKNFCERFFILRDFIRINITKKKSAHTKSKNSSIKQIKFSQKEKNATCKIDEEE